MRAGNDAVRRIGNGSCDLAVEQSEGGVHMCRCALDQTDRPDELGRHRPAGHLKILDRALRRGSIERVCRYLDRAEAVRFGARATRHGGISLAACRQPIRRTVFSSSARATDVRRKFVHIATQCHR
jgi:hypothetical protein